MKEEGVQFVPQESSIYFAGKDSKDNITSRALTTGAGAVDNSNPCSTSPLCPAPISRQFWRAGSYNDGQSVKPTLQKGTSYLRIHPKFLHSNATSHKWAFGAVAELLDNAIDEIQNGATVAIVDRIMNPKDGTSALLIQDDGGGMDPEAVRRCLSFGFSERKSNSAIGQYGNGFKTSTMRLGSDVIVFSRSKKKRESTQSIGLLSYTFLMETGHDQILVPMVHYERNGHTDEWKTLLNSQQHMTNLSLLLRWSPYSTEAELLKQFDNVGHHGTKIVIYNLWHSDDGKIELDFESDPQDICISGETTKKWKAGSRNAISDEHLSNRLQFSLRAYLSILYLRIPENFSILLRGQAVEYHSIANDLKFPEAIVYKPHNGGSVITAIGFVKEAPVINVHGFNVYHKNRLILPFWHVVSYSDNRGRGVVGILEADFIQPTHNKQDFEKTPVFQKLECRLKQMTWEYWDYHCHLVGYQIKRKISTVTPKCTSVPEESRNLYKPAILNAYDSAVLGMPFKRKENSHPLEPERSRRKVGIEPKAANSNEKIIPAATVESELKNGEADNLVRENKKLRTQCMEYERRAEKLNLKAARLRIELTESEREYSRLLLESKLLQRSKK